MLPLTPVLSADAPSGIALMDLDGTLLAWDCQLLFRHFVIRREPWRALLLPVFLLLLPLFPLLKARGMKRIFLSFLWRMPPATLATHARAFAANVRPAFYPELLEMLEEHRRQGHLLILASASPEFYVTEVGRALGFHLALGTPVVTTPTCPFFPALHNHKGAAKVARLRKLLPDGYFTAGKLLHSHGYTDSRADLPMLALCQTATVVNPAPSLSTLARAAGWRIVRPARPWRSRLGLWCRAAALLTGLGKDPAGLHPSGSRPA
ncbi:MAG: HAD-IB family phosphatase [Verrucomicrobiota bacterium]